MTPAEHAAEAARLLGRWDALSEGGRVEDLPAVALGHAVLALQPEPVFAPAPAPVQVQVDRDGDLWAFSSGGRAWTWDRKRRKFTTGPQTRAAIERAYGPMTPVPGLRYVLPARDES